MKFSKIIENILSEKNKSLAKKAEKTGISYSILKKVYDRGMAAWNSGHNPGTPQAAWAMGRVNSFITGKGGARKADADLWKGRKKESIEEIRKGDYVDSMGEIGLVNKVKGQVAYVKFDSNPKSFHPMMASSLKKSGKHKGKDLYTEGKLTESMIGIQTKANFKPNTLKGELERAGIKGFQMNRLSVTMTALKLDKKDFEKAKKIIDKIPTAKIQMAKEGKVDKEYTKGLSNKKKKYGSKDAMEKEIEKYKGKDKYKADWDADYKKDKDGKKVKIKTKKGAASKAYAKMYGEYFGIGDIQDVVPEWTTFAKDNPKWTPDQGLGDGVELEEAPFGFTGVPFPQETPNEFAYLDFKKYVYKNQKSIKNKLGLVRPDKMFKAIELLWIMWAKRFAKEWSNVKGNKFGRELTKMLWKDNLLFDKSGNKITKLQEASSVWKVLDAKWKLQDEIMDLEMDMKEITKDLSQLHKDMEQEAEPGGGRIADRYGREIEKKEKEYKKKKAEFKRLMAKLDRLESY